VRVLFLLGITILKRFPKGFVTAVAASTFLLITGSP